MRKVQLVDGEYYHIFNRGVDKRDIFLDEEDFSRFIKSMVEFNVLEPIGSIYENSFRKKIRVKDKISKPKNDTPLVEYIAYCLNKNHFHLIIKQYSEKGIEKLMHRLGLGFTKYFNQKYKRSGSLFQGTFKSVHIESNEQLLYLSAYVNLNNRVHKTKLGNLVSKSSWEEFVGKPKERLCKVEIVLDQFRNVDKYKKIVEETVEEIRSRREGALFDDIMVEDLETKFLSDKKRHGVVT